MAFEVVAAIIDFVGMSNLSYLQSGHYSYNFGIKTTEELIAMYSAPLITTDEAVNMININKLFNREMTWDEIYEATRKS